MTDAGAPVAPRSVVGVLDAWCFDPLGARGATPEWDFDEGDAVDMDEGEDVDLTMTQEQIAGALPRPMLRGMNLALVDDKNRGVLIC